MQERNTSNTRSGSNASNRGLQVGDKYLTIRILNHLEVAAFPNKNRKDDFSPHFIGNGVAVWVNTKKEPKQSAAKEELLGDF